MPPALRAAFVATLQLGVVHAESEVRVACRALTKERAAAFEARVRADLAVRGVEGALSLSCAGQAMLRWQPQGAAPAAPLVLPEGALSVERLFEAYTQLVTQADPERNVTEPSPSAPEPDAPPASEKLSPSEPLQSAPMSAPSTTPGPTSEAPGSEGDARGNEPRPSESAAPEAIRHDAVPAHEPSDVGNPRPDTDAAPSPALALAFGGATSWWQSDLALGVSAAGRWLLSDWFGAEAELAGSQSLATPSAVTTRLLELGLAARVVPLSHTAVTLGIRGGLAEVRASGDLQLVDSAANDCGLNGNGGWCPLASAEFGLWWSPDVVRWRPEVGTLLAWSPRSIAVRIGEGNESLSTLPSLRPRLIVRLAWSDP